MKDRTTSAIGKYFFSTVIDVFLICIITALSVIPIGIISGVLFGEIGESGLIFLTVLDVAIIFYFYFIFLFKRTGQTVAMKMFKLRVISKKSERLSFITAIVWGIYLIFPILILCSISFALIPPYSTQLERLTDTLIIEL